jgi:osmotically inducible lipoprotein OsmB
MRLAYKANQGDKSNHAILRHSDAGPVFLIQGLRMTTRLITLSGTALLLLGMAACSGMSTQDKNTAIGAGAGAVGGAVLTGGSALGTVGGAAVGGIIGHEVSKPKQQ